MADIIRREPYGNGTRPVVKCTCDAEVLCVEFTNTCDKCGTEFNSSGQTLGPRAFWGEETGEQPSDCVGPFYADDLNNDNW